VDGLPALPGVEHHWIDIRSVAGPVRLHLAAAGSGTPVLLLHGGRSTGGAGAGSLSN